MPGDETIALAHKEDHTTPDSSQGSSTHLTSGQINCQPAVQDPHMSAASDINPTAREVDVLVIQSSIVSGSSQHADRQL